MKIYILYSLMLFPFLLLGQSELNQSYTTNGLKYLIVSNFNGSMEVIPSNDDQIHVEVIKERGKTNGEFFIDQVRKNDFLTVFYRAPCMKANADLDFDPENPISFFSFDSHGRDFNCQGDGDPFKDFGKFKFVVKVPKGIYVYVSTINDGDISVSNISNHIYANNINGDISLKNVSIVEQAKTINGDVEVVFKDQPSRSGVYSTINGDIEIELGKSTDLQANFKSFQGDFYTDFENTAVIESKPKKIKEKKKVIMKMEEYTSIVVGKGGVELNLETFNGNAYLKSK